MIVCVSTTPAPNTGVVNEYPERVIQSKVQLTVYTSSTETSVNFPPKMKLPPFSSRATVTYATSKRTNVNKYKL